VNQASVWKSIGAVFILLLVLANSSTIGNFVAANTNFVSSPSDGVSLGANGYSTSWNPDSGGNFDDGATSVELVIGIAAKPNSYGGLSGLVSLSGGEITNPIALGQKQAIVVSVPTESASSLAAEARALGLASYVEPNIKYAIDSTPNDTYWSLQWGPQMIRADYAWNTTTGSDAILVAVVDTGIDYTHPDLIANYVPLGRDWVDDDDFPLDDHGHGTHVAGTIAATMNNAMGVAGLAQVRIMAEKAIDVNGSGSSSDLALAIRHAVDEGANIINNSWGSNQSSQVIHDAIQYAQENGVLVLAAAGNDGNDVPHYPAYYEEVVAVSATNSSDMKSPFSTYGDWVDVAAPGSLIASTMPTYMVSLTDPEFMAPYSPYSMNYAYLSGTSMACPHAAGVAALIWSLSPGMTADLVRYQLESTCDDIGEPGFDVYFGNGRINAKNAVEEVAAHDVLVSAWGASGGRFLKVNLPADFYVTVFNRGATTETGVQVHLYVNGTIVDSTAISAIPTLTQANASLSWTPTTLGTYNVTVYVTPQPEEAIIENNAAMGKFIVGAPPSEANWTLVASDPDEGGGMNLKAVSTQQQSNVVYFKVEFHRPWVQASTDINTAILVDADQNPRTGLPDHHYTNQNTGLGADYLIIVGDEGPVMWKWNSAVLDTITSIDLAYLDAPDNSSTFIVGVRTVDLETEGVFDFAVADAFSSWDWMPNTGHRPFIQERAEHELAVTLFNNATGIQPSETLVLNATAYNFGLNAEANVNLQIQINGTAVTSEIVPQLSNGSSYSVLYNWTPLNQAIYNITAYAAPVTGEDNIVNNVETALVLVSQKIAVITDLPLSVDLLPIVYALKDTLDSMYVNYDFYSSNYIHLYTENLALLQSYQTVVFHNYDDAITLAEQSALNEYLATGGNLLVTGYDSLGDPDDPRLADVVRSSSYGDNYGEPDLYVVNSNHPIMSGPHGQFPEGYYISNLYDDADAAEADTARGAVTIAELADGKAKIIATDSLPGKVVYWNGEGIFDWTMNADCNAMLKNTLIWFLGITPPITTDDYNGAWYTADFTINLVADDYVADQTYYRINGGPTQRVSINGQPLITTENSNNTLEYWSVDVFGQEESHSFLTQIKLDKTAPTGSLQINKGDSHTNRAAVTLTLTATDATSGIHQVRYSNDGEWDTETWETFDATKAWTLPYGYGAKTVYYQIKDNAGLTSTYSDSIIRYTTSPPTTTAPTPTPTSTPTATPTPTPSATNTINATADNGSTVALAISGNITSTQITDATIRIDQTAGTTTVSLTITGQSGTTGYGNITIPKSQVPYGSTPILYIDDQPAENQGYSQDADNYYVWYTVHFSTHALSVVFTGAGEKPLPPDYTLLIAVAVIAAIICVAAAVVVLRKRR
jgi:thermitase